jgi:hypothetical protein
MEMTIDERLDRLTERHEALTQTIELMVLDSRENTRNIATLSLVVQKLASSIDTLWRIAEPHEDRVDKLDGE